MKTNYSYLLEEYPSTISMDQLYKICHISKRKASWYLENGVIPCEDSGKQTRRYTIKITDVIRFLEKQDAGKLPKLPPPGIFASQSSYKRINYKKVRPSAFSSLLKKLWVRQPDVINALQVAVLLGYQSTTINKWIRDGKLEAIAYHGAYLIPKEWLIKYLAATVNENRAAKSTMHMKLILQCQKTSRPNISAKIGRQ